MRIPRSYPKRTIEHADGRRHIRESGYYRLFVSPPPELDRFHEVKEDIARLASKIHSASITNGNRLETDYIQHPDYNHNQPLRNPEVISHPHQLRKGHYAHQRFSVYGKKTEVDYVTVDMNTQGVWVNLYEIKDGGEMDTKKSQSEIDALFTIRNFLYCYQPVEYSPLHVRCFIVLWNAPSIQKGMFKASQHGLELITGRQMCSLLGGMDFDQIAKDRMNMGSDNFHYTIRQLRTILYKYDMTMGKIDTA